MQTCEKECCAWHYKSAAVYSDEQPVEDSTEQRSKRCFLSCRKVTPKLIVNKNKKLSTQALARAQLPPCKTADEQAGLGASIWFLPVPAGMNAQAWHLLAIVIAIMGAHQLQQCFDCVEYAVGIVLQPLPSGAIARAAVVTIVHTKTLPFSASFSALGARLSSLPLIVFTILYLHSQSRRPQPLTMFRAL